MRRLALVALFALLGAPLLACPVCFQVDESATTDGLRAAVVVLVAVTTSVLTGFGIFIYKFARRS